MPERVSQRVTLRHLAREAGLSLGTISMALRDDPRIAAATRRRVRGLAQTLGYRPDPFLGALAAYRRGSAAPATFASQVLALLTPPDWLGSFEHTGLRTWFRDTHRGILARAAHYGFEVQLFPLPAPEAEQRALSRVLLSRGIRGILLAPPTGSVRALALDWGAFSVVAFDLMPGFPSHRFNFCYFDLARSIDLALEGLAAEGIHRVGYFHTESLERHEERRGLGAFESHPRVAAMPGGRIPAFLGTGNVHEPASNPSLRTELGRWLRRHVPEAVLTPLYSGGRAFRCLQAWQASPRPRDPRIRWISLQRDPLDPHPGIDPHGELIGVTAVDLLNTMLATGERGVPPVTRGVFVEGTWHPGHSPDETRCDPHCPSIQSPRQRDGNHPKEATSAAAIQRPEPRSTSISG